MQRREKKTKLNRFADNIHECVNESAIFEIQAKEMQYEFTAMCKTEKMSVRWKAI